MDSWVAAIESISAKRQ
uniref:Uncharacterized protein n=1 Tax=Arundo donax TaxID=35708 RepID=A0A0A9BLW0_ARUDO